MSTKKTKKFTRKSVNIWTVKLRKKLESLKSLKKDKMNKKLGKNKENQKNLFK